MPKGKVTGITSAAIDISKRQRDQLRQDALEALLDYYSAPDGDAGDKQREVADGRVQAAWREARKLSGRVAALENLTDDARASKDDLARWLGMVD